MAKKNKEMSSAPNGDVNFAISDNLFFILNF